MTPTTNLELAILAVGCKLELVLKWGFGGNAKNLMRGLGRVQILILAKNLDLHLVAS